MLASFLYQVVIHCCSKRDLPRLHSVHIGTKSFSEVTEFPFSSPSSFSLLLIVLDTLTTLTIGEECFNNITSDLEICNYPYLKKIVIKKNALQNLASFKIANNTSLISIEIEDGEKWYIGDMLRVNGAFINVDTLIIEGTSVNE